MAGYGRSGIKPTRLAKRMRDIIKVKTGVIVDPEFNRVQSPYCILEGINLDGLKWYMISKDGEVLVGSRFKADTLDRSGEVKKVEIAGNIILLELGK